MDGGVTMKFWRGTSGCSGAHLRAVTLDPGQLTLTLDALYLTISCKGLDNLKVVRKSAGSGENSWK